MSREIHKRGRCVALAACVLAMGGLGVARADDVYVPIQTQEVRGFAMVQGVNARTGNYAVTYPAFELHGVPFRRTYNSNGGNQGTFGQGWGSMFDTRAVGMADGRVAVLENGNGATTVYGPSPAGETQEQMDRAVAEAARHPTPGVFDVIGAKLEVETPHVLEESVSCGTAVLGTAVTGYVRSTCSKHLESFDRDGRLTRLIAQRPYGLVDIRRDDAGRVVDVTDHASRTLHFERTGATLKVTDETGAWLAYEFDAQGRNTRITGSDAPTYRFSYNAAGLLTQITYMDDTTLKIAYDSSGRVTRLTQRDDGVVEFRYQPDGRSTLVVQKPRAGDPAGMLFKFVD